MNLSELRQLIDTDRNLGAVYPEKPLHALPHKGARGHALDRFRDFLGMLVFRREVSESETQAFKVPRERIFIASPDQSHEDPKLTGIALLPGPYSYDDKYMYAIGRPDADEATIDRYGRGTVLLTLGYYAEQITFEAVSASYAVTRGIVEGTRYALRYFTDSGQLRLKCPDYFDQVAGFSIISGDGYGVDLMFEAQQRRVAHLRIELWVPEMALVDYRRGRVILDFGTNGMHIRDGNVYPTLG